MPTPLPPSPSLELPAQRQTRQGGASLPLSEQPRQPFALPDLTHLAGTDRRFMEGDKSAKVPASATDRINPNDRFCYFIRVRMANSSLGGFSLLVHKRLIEEEELKAMVADAVKLTNTVRIKSRRQDLVDNKVPIRDAVKVNEEWFPTDVDFFEGVMCDRHDFRVIKCETAIAEIEPTVKIKPQE